MTKQKNDPITLELHAYVVDMLADWARLSGRIMAPAVVPGEKRKQDAQSADLAQDIVLAVLNSLPAFTDGDLAEALAERDAAYAAYRAANPK
ncbi:hypothetical protein [Pseudomonas kitaguniensis]|uniref:hypothetical protein n=1 Tax=Pseudomonas kitaguniensis TaxID=2607908 RepID=UPI003B9F421B